MPMTTEELADAIYERVEEYRGRKKFTTRELTKFMVEKFEGDCDKKACKQAFRLLTESGRCVYTYKGTSYLEIPDEGGVS